MHVIYLPDTTQYHNLYTLTGLTQGTTLFVHNASSSLLSVTHSLTQPSPSYIDVAFVETDETYVLHANGLPLWVKGGIGPIVIQAATERVALPISSVDIPHDFYTSPKELYRRIKVDPGQTSFHDGREFRTFYEFSIGAGASVYIQANAGVDTILYDVSCVVDAGSIRLRTYAGSTGTGTYDVALPVLPKNTMSIRSTPIYPAANTLFTGGTGVTGGVVIDTVRVVAANATAQQSSVGSKAFDQRGVGAGTYYWRLENIAAGTATGVFSGWWAEILNLGI